MDEADWMFYDQKVRKHTKENILRHHIIPNDSRPV
eukprot:COSAG01_NODE_6358_length_3705_cov_1.144635_2_plen_35_part_00